LDRRVWKREGGRKKPKPPSCKKKTRLRHEVGQGAKDTGQGELFEPPIAVAQKNERKRGGEAVKKKVVYRKISSAVHICDKK